MKRIDRIILVLIVIIGVFFRFYKLELIPSGLYVDEAAIGYNAFSILKTGKDEYGKFFPLLFRSFGDYKMPGLIYLTTIPIAILGLNIFSIRFLSAFAGVINIFIVYLIAKESYPKIKLFPIVSAAVFAFSPWSVFFSRAVFENNVALLFLSLGIYYFMKPNRRLKFLIFGYGWLATSAYTYHCERLIAPIIGLIHFGYLFLKCRNLPKLRRNLIIAFGIFLLLILPMVFISFMPAGQVRLVSLSFSKYPGFFGKIYEFISQYVAYFSARNLFMQPDSDLQRSFPQLSVFYPWMVIPYFIGLWLFFNKKNKSLADEIVFWLLILSPVPASLARDPFSTLRAQPLVLPISLIISLGICAIAKMIASRSVKLLLITGIVVLSLWGLWKNTFVLLPKERALAWNYGYQQIVAELANNELPVLVEDAKGVSYIEYLFFGKYNPAEYQKEVAYKEKYYSDIKWNPLIAFGNIQVRPIHWRKDIEKKQLIVASPISISDRQAAEHMLERILEVRSPGGEALLRVYRTTKEPE